MGNQYHETESVGESKRWGSGEEGIGSGDSGCGLVALVGGASILGYGVYQVIQYFIN